MKNFASVLVMGCLLSGMAFASGAAPASDETVWIGRADGSRQCEQSGGLVRVHPLEEGQKQLEALSVTVLESRKAREKGVQTTKCGAPTGKQNQYRIRKSDLDKVLQNKDLGFVELKDS
ncbi:hypothetical protein K2X30_12975 [bacterium]|jgi:hypothetical protein|nr:hypothetical protein [bacterium]